MPRHILVTCYITVGLHLNIHIGDIPHSKAEQLGQRQTFGHITYQNILPVRTSLIFMRLSECYFFGRPVIRYLHVVGAIALKISSCFVAFTEGAFWYHRYL